MKLGAMEKITALESENLIALDLQQVLLGAISENVRAISFRLMPPKLSIFWYINQDSEQDREEAFDSITELEAIHIGRFPDCELQVVVGCQPFPRGLESLEGRPVFARRVD